MNSIALAFVKSHEGCELTAYQDSAKVWTIGYGATGKDVVSGLVWTQTQADARLASDLDQAETELRVLLAAQGVTGLSEQQMAALISFVFNLGIGALAKSELFRCIKERSYLAAASQWIRWDHAGGKEVRGLLIRRLEEAALFLRGS